MGEHFKLDVDKGAWVQKINGGGPADKAGLRGGSGAEVFQGSEFARGGDVITKIGDTPVENADDLYDEISRHKPGETVDLEVQRGGETEPVNVFFKQKTAYEMRV